MVRFNRILIAFIICFFVSIEEINGWRTFWKGRRNGGNLIPPHSHLLRHELPADQWFEQKLDHFNENNNSTWKQVRINVESKMKMIE